MNLKAYIFLAALLSLSRPAYGAETMPVQDSSEVSMQTAPVPSGHIVHHFGVRAGGAWLAQTHSFFRGENEKERRLDRSGSTHLQYSFSFPSGSHFGTIYPTSYQGVGVGFNTFFDKKEIGTPVALYVFQGAQIARLAQHFSLGYEWNFGASFGWRPYDEETNGLNMVVGSMINAYINAGILLSWRPTSVWAVTVGVDVSHFSNGNTKYPNSGVNTVGLRVGAVYSIGEDNVRRPGARPGPAVYGSNDFRTGRRPFVCDCEDSAKPKARFRNRIVTDVVLYGALRTKGVIYDNTAYITDGHFGIVGLNVSPMCRLGKCFQTGISLDVQYDESANVQNHVASIETGDDGKNELRFYRPPLREQLAGGLSLRAELVMPIFTVDIGIGHNVICRGDDLSGFYQIVALKASVTRRIFIHIGYKLRNFRDPNNLMLGIGCRI